MDDELRRLWERLSAARPGRGPLIVITSDHGEAFGEHGGYLHAQSLYREELLVPLVIHGPGVPSGIRISRPVTNVAIPATVLELTSGTESSTFGTRSLVALWRDPEARLNWPYPLAEARKRDWADPRVPIHHGDIRSLLSPEWHYISPDTLPKELYAWSDVLEQHDRSTDPDVVDVMREFESVLMERIRTSRSGN